MSNAATRIGAFGPCEGEVLPAPETCANPADEDCCGGLIQAVGRSLEVQALPRGATEQRE